MKSRYLLISLHVLLPCFLLAQQANDECIDAIAIPQELEFCSGPGTFSNVGATSSLMPNDYPVCIDEPDQIQDVWFSFVALRNSVNIIVTGNTDSSPGGSLRAPQFALYDGDCGSLVSNSVACRSPFESPPTSGQFLNGGNIIFNQLVVGQTYFIMVGARNGISGTFELCINQFDAVPEPSGDCSSGVILCDKSPFAVQELQGFGQVRDDLLSGNIDCGGGDPQESNSSWYKWTCDQSGTLSFDITPLGAAFNEDIDFVLYELGNGLDDCSSRTPLRQMFSGETRGAGAANIPCLGTTGLSDADPDRSEDCGCEAGNNNFLSSIDMVAGRSYALVIMNFTQSGDGFSIEFGGTGTFVGPEPAFTFSSSEVCVGDALTFQDQSTSLDMIVSREWDFGPTATPRTASGAGPHSVVFGAPGTPAVQLTIETSRECREILNQQEVNVVCCDGQFTGSALTTDVLCPNDITGSINLTAGSSFSPTTLSYNWSNGAMSEDIDNLAQGDYTVTVSDESGCEETYSFTVDGPEVFTFDTLITMPDCAGGTNGALEFAVLGGGQGPYEYSFNNGPFGPDNRITDLSVQTVSVRAQDANGCLIDQTIEVNELELGLVQGESVFTEPVCAGEASGRIEIQLANGMPAYEYDFGLGAGFQPSNAQGGLAAGTYPVIARDADGCRGEFDIVITEPPAITLVADPEGSTCFGTDDGSIVVLSGGGRPGFSYRWSDGSTTDSVRTDLVPGTYTVSLTDQNGCVRTLTETLTEPNEIFPVLEQTNDLTCNGEPTGSFLLSATGGTPDYEYSADGQTFQPAPLLENLLAGDYRLYVMDANGCIDSLNGSLTEPVEFIIDPGGDRSIILGFDTILRAVSNYNPVSYVWGPDSLLCLDPLCTRVRAAPVATTLYTVVGTNPAGCTDTAMVELKVIQDLPLFIPNVFSPNGDGANDGFTVFGGRAIEQIDALRIYNRWGGLVFEREAFFANEPSLGWDGTLNGKPVNPAVFVYYASVRYINGTVVEYAGDVTVVR